MLFYLKYIHHCTEKLHDLLVFFFDKVEKENPVAFDSASLFPTWYREAEHKITSLEKQLTTFLTFNQEVKLAVIKAFKDANEIQMNFSSSANAIPTAQLFNKYHWKTEIKANNDINFTVTDFLRELFVGLSINQLANKKSTFCKIIGHNLTDYYKAFVEANKNDFNAFTVCPICGLEKMRDEDNVRKPDHDHLLPKGENLFVFSSVNLKNLFPIGTDCNTRKDTALLLYSDQTLTNRTISFYPYDNSPHPFEKYTIKLLCDQVPEPSNGYSGKWTVNIEANDNLDRSTADKIETWDRVFHIKARIAKTISDSHKSLIDRELEITKVTSKHELLEKIKTQIERYQFKYSFLSTEVDLIPKRIFFEWASNNPDYLENFVAINSIAKTSPAVDIKF